MSWVAEANATTSAAAPNTTSPDDVPIIDIRINAAPITICASAIQPRRRPNLPKKGARTRSMIGAQRNFSEYAMPTHERKPIAASVVPSSRSQYPRVLPTRRNGRPDEKPSTSIVNVRGRVYGWIVSFQRELRCHCGARTTVMPRRAAARVQKKPVQAWRRAPQGQQVWSENHPCLPQGKPACQFPSHPRLAPKSPYAASHV